jgi:hypothetical protein
MKTIAEYRSQTLIILGDTAGRRYSEAQLDQALRQALERLGSYRPARETYKVSIETIEIRDAVINWCPGPDSEILTVRNSSGEWLGASDYRTAGKTYISIYSGPIPTAGDWLLLEISVPHTISGLDGAGTTTVSESLMTTICTGAAGYAMQIRARSVTEVFGKRPEDTDKLILQSNELLNQFYKDLGRPANLRDPLPRGGFEI